MHCKCILNAFRVTFKFHFNKFGIQFKNGYQKIMILLKYAEMIKWGFLFDKYMRYETVTMHEY